jgi:hypothetical protein
MGTCPACNGSTREPVPESSQRYIKYNARWGHWGCSGYEPAGPGPFQDGQGYEGGTYPCGNCGGTGLAIFEQKQSEHVSSLRPSRKTQWLRLPEYEYVVEVRDRFAEPQPVSAPDTYLQALLDVVKYAELKGVALKSSPRPDEWFLQVPHTYNMRITITQVKAGENE